MGIDDDDDDDDDDEEEEEKEEEEEEKEYGHDDNELRPVRASECHDKLCEDDMFACSDMGLLREILYVHVRECETWVNEHEFLTLLRDYAVCD